MAQLVFLLSKAPHGSSYGREALEAALMAAAFEQGVTLVFESDGVLQLLDGQTPDAIGEKDVAAAYRALELYGIEDVRVHGPSLAARGLDVNDLLIETASVDDAGLRELIGKADQVLTF